MARSTDNKKSRYIQGGETEEFQKRLGYWDRKIISRRDDDISYTIPVKYANRPDLVSYEFYGTPDLMWLVLQYNNILDPTVEFIAGKEIILPTSSRVVLSVLTK